MKKELKDYLHLYLGCQIQLPISENPETNGVLQLTASVLNNLEDFNEWERCRLILRPLSDMTGIEAAQLVEIGTSVYDFIGIRKVDRYEIMFDAGYATSSRTWLKHLRFSELEAEQFKFLLSKHFDLFGLIKAGLAIDKTTI